ncbi:MAG: MATE family efflux transporter [Lachnospiraceae bacterium]|nr:MATE family efflux transporter [Lachnospiraceae bacterium]
MTKGPLFGKILLFAIPLMFSSILQLMFNAADIIIVGQFAKNGPQSIAAVGATASLINMLVSLFVGIAVGVNVLVAKFYAIKNDEAVSETVHTSLMLSIVGGIILAVIGVMVSKPVLLAMGTPDDVIDLATTYMRIYCCGMPSLFLYNLGSATLRAVGDTRRPLYFLAISGVLNIILNICLVVGLHLDVAGVAIATIVSETLSAALVLICLAKSDQSYKFEISKMKFYPDKFTKILALGIPAGLQGMIFSFSNVLIQSSVNYFGSMVMAGNAAAQNLEGFVYMSMNSVYQACVTFTSQNLGAGKYERIHKVLGACLVIVTAVGLIMGNAFYFFGTEMLGIFTKNPETIQYGLNRMAIICVPYFLCGLMDTVCGSLRGLGYSVLPMVVSLIGACGLRIVWIYTVFRVFHNLTVLYISYPVTWTITACVHLICYMIIVRKKGWNTK